MFIFSKSKSVNFYKLYCKAKHIYNEIPLVKKKRKQKIFFKILQYISLFILIIFFVFIIIIAVNFNKLKFIYQEAMDGKSNIEYALELFKDSDYNSAENFSQIAVDNFAAANEGIKKYQSNFLVKNIKVLSDTANNAVYFISSAQLLSRSLFQSATLIKNFNVIIGGSGVSFAKMPKKEKILILNKINQSVPGLNGIKANLDLALLNLKQIKLNGLFYPFKNKIIDFRFKLREAKENLFHFLPLAKLSPIIFGYPQKSDFLVMLQNNSELRPTGGFLGTYGILEMEDGDINRFDTHDIYHMDMPVKNKLKETPPEALKKYLGINNWYLRDSNWSPNWPTAVKKILWFYNKENKLLPPKNKINNFNGKFQGVIGITPEFITDLLSLTGPIVIDGEKYTKDNFQDLLEYRVEKGYVKLGIPSWHRKKMIGNVFKKIKEKLFNLPPNKLYRAFLILSNNLYKKNIIVYFQDEGYEDIIKSMGWGGEIKPTENDFLMVVDANMASLKTDLVVHKNIEYTLNSDQNGLFAHLKINYAHTGKFDWKTTRYRTYTRVYVPKGSQLISVSGAQDDNIKSYEKEGKTVFATFFSLEPGKIGTLSFYYKLPMRINKNNYSLFLEKQPGNLTKTVIINLNFNRPIKYYAPTGFNVYKLGDNHIKWETDLLTDKKFNIVFKK